MREYLQSFQLFTDLEIKQFLKLSQTIVLKKGDFFVGENEICNSLGFIKKGIFRSFYYSNNAEEITYCFTFPNHLLMAYSSFISEKKSEEIIQALTDSEIVIIPKSSLHLLAKSNSKWVDFLKTIAEREYVELEQWIFNHQKDKAQQRYIDFITKQPNYIQQIPLKYIASYLGVTQRHLSRIRAQINY